MDITLTDNAYEHLVGLRKAHNKEFIRLDVKAGGCAGYEYEWSFDDADGKDDRIVDDILLVHKMYEIYLGGTEIDYDKDDFGATFKFSNPAAKSSCGCGTSFSV